MTNEFDMMLLDVMLPRMDGFTVLRKLREDRIRTQVIIVSSRDSMRDVVYGLDAGADDYLTKPFPLDVLLAKVRAVMRRAAAPMSKALQFADLVLRPNQFELQRGERVETSDAHRVRLAGNSYARRARTVVPHGVLIDEGWGSDCDVSFDSLYMFIRALRAKIDAPGEPELLFTVRGVGYSLRGEILLMPAGRSQRD